jgi:GNAT superfamily N-acetyltransferase
MNTQTTVIEVDSHKLLKEFVRFPSELYKSDPNFVCPLETERLEFFDKKKNPFYSGARTKLFLAKRGEETVGRISTCVYFAHNEIHKEKVGFFGFFESINDEEVAHALLKVALITLKKEGMTSMRGPASFTLNHECGLLVDGFNSPPVVMMTYNHPYLVKLVENFGLEKVMDLYAFMINDEKPLPERVMRLTEKIAKRSAVTIRSIDMKRFDEEVQLISRIYNEAWEDNWGFAPMTTEEFEFMAKNLKQVVDPDLALIAEVDGKPVAFSLTLPDINQALIHLDGKLLPFGIFKLIWHTKIKNKVVGVRTVTMGVIPDYRKRGIDTLLYVKTFVDGTAKGYKWSELSWALETNTLLRSLVEGIGARLYKTYRLYDMPI